MSDVVSEFVDGMAERTRGSHDYSSYVKEAFLLGLYYQDFPQYSFLGLRRAYWWEIYNIWKEGVGLPDEFTAMNQNSTLFCFAFVSETNESWHQVYRDWRAFGWERQAIKRDGARLSYLFKRFSADKPEDFQTIWLLLDISIRTCKQVQVGVQTIPVMKTVCEELTDIEDHEAEVNSPPPSFNSEAFMQDLPDPPEYTGKADLVAEVNGQIVVVDTIPEDDIPF